MKWGNIKISINKNFNNQIKDFDVECFFIDLDGTALDGKRHTISETNAKKIKEINKITPVVISTGRSFGSKVKGLMKSLDIEYAICQNGSIIANNKNEILQQIFIDSSLISLIKRIARQYRVIIIPDSKYELYSNVLYLKPLIWLSRKHYFKVEDFDETEKYNKLVLAGCRKRKLFKIFLKLKDDFPSLSIKTSANDWIIEITDIKATKGLAALYLAKILNVKPNNSVHIGDSMNDTSTLDYLGALIAMKNSSKHLLNVATHTGPSYKKGGLAKILDGHFSENTEKK